MENRTLLALVPVTLNIHELVQLENPDVGDDGDYYAEVTIGNNPEQSTRNHVDNPIEGSSFNPHWFFTEFVDPADGLVPVTIQIFDSDDVSSDEFIDINPTSGERTLEFLFDPNNAVPLEGHAVGDAGEDTAEITFKMFRSAQVDFTVVRVDELSDPDDNDPTEGNGGDYAFGVKFGDYREFFSPNFVWDPGNVGLTYTAFVDPLDVVTSIDVRVVDIDTLSGDETMDINPRSGASNLSLFYNPTTGQWDEQNGDFTFPVNVTEGNEGDRARLTFNITTPTADTDGDGLLDSWETNGIDVNGDGTVDFHPQSDPLHKDLFIEVDAMTGRAPMAGVLQDVIDAFAAVPNSLVNNPDGQDGINLRVLLDETNVALASWATNVAADVWDGFDAVKANLDPNVAGGFGTVADRQSPNRDNILAAKRPVFRYAVFADRHGSNDSSGRAEIGGNDFMVTLGSLWTNVTRGMQAGTFMHELGHTLGFYHGGHQVDLSDDDTYNRKPNYHSVMNYLWQLPLRITTTSTTNEIAYASSWTLDYSRSAFPSLDEDALSEAAGIGGHAGHTVRLENGRFVTETGAADWDGDGSTDAGTVAVDVNADGERTVLAGSEDWSRVAYSFRNHPDYADGVHNTSLADEITFTEYVEANDALLYSAPAGNGADDLTLRRNGGLLEIFDNNAGVVVASRALADTRIVDVAGADGEDDTLTVDFAIGGHFVVPSGVAFAGGAGGGNDRLRVVGAGAATGTYTPSATSPGDGTVAVASGGESSVIHFAGLEPVEVTGLASVALVTPNGDDDVAVAPGTAAGGQAAHVVTGTSGGVAFESLVVYDVPRLTLDTGAGDSAGAADDDVSVALGTADTGLDRLDVRSGDGDDLVDVTASKRVKLDADLGAGAGDTLLVRGDGQAYLLTGDQFTTLFRKPIEYAGAETLDLFAGSFSTLGAIAPGVVANDGATLWGVGHVLGPVAARAGGTVAPGVLGAGVLKAGGADFDAGATFKVRLGGLTPGHGHSQLHVTGGVDLGGATLAGSLHFNPTPGDAIVIVRNDGADPVSGAFAQGAMVTIGGKPFAIDYAYDGDNDGNANDVALIRFGAALAPAPAPGGGGHGDDDDDDDDGRTALYVSGTTGVDQIRFVSASGGRVRVLVNGDDLGTFKVSGPLIAFGQSGNDTITNETASRDAWFWGQAGDDLLSAGNAHAVLVGGLGDDRLRAGNGADVLVGGPGADDLEAGGGDDLLIAGSTKYDTNTAANRNVWARVQDEWRGGKGGYTVRVNRLRTTLLRPGVDLLNDTSVDDLLGGTGKDWFLMNATGPGPLDTADQVLGEIVTDL